MVERSYLTPFRNYFCQECGADFDHFKMAIRCPICGGERVSECPNEDEEDDDQSQI